MYTLHFTSLVCKPRKNIFLGGIMLKSDYDYVVEMMKEYHHEDDVKRWYVINYDAIADALCIATRSKKWSGTSEVKNRFKEEYKSYVSRRLREINDPLAIIMFQGTYEPVILRNRPRNGMSYIEDNLRQVIKGLPKLSRGEHYVFPALKIIRAEDGSDAFIL